MKKNWILAVSMACVLLGASLPLFAAPADDTSSAAAEQRVDLNTATHEELVALPGIGEKVAARIIEYREKNGNFEKAEELMNVRGIGEKTFLKLQSRVTVGKAQT